MPPQDLTDIPKVVNVLGFQLTLDHHVIYIDFNILAQLWLKHFSHHPIISRPYIFQSKRHHFVMVVSNRSDKIRFFLIFQG